MSCKLTIKPRQTGKTALLFAEFAKNVSGIYVTKSISLVDLLQKQYGRTGGIISETQLVNAVAIDTQATYYLDDYFNYSIETKKFIFNHHILRPMNIVAVGTPNVQFKEKDAQDVAFWWSCMKSRKHTNVLRPEDVMCEIYGEDLMYSLLVAPDTEILKPTTDERHKQMSKEQYEMHVLGQIFTE